MKDIIKEVKEIKKELIKEARNTRALIILTNEETDPFKIFFKSSILQIDKKPLENGVLGLYFPGLEKEEAIALTKMLAKDKAKGQFQILKFEDETLYIKMTTKGEEYESQ